MITAPQLYDHVSCPRRVELDLRGDSSRRDEVSAFVRMLWERGSAFEGEVASRLPGYAVSYAHLEPGHRARATARAMQVKVGIIHGGRIAIDDLLGDPDLLILVNGRYMAADVKSGRGEEGGDDEADGRPKAHYAVQVAHYTHILERLGQSAGRFAEIWDSRGERVRYDLDAAKSTRSDESWWDLYERTRDAVAAIAAGGTTRAAMAASCGLCHWRAVCREELVAAGDLTLIPGLGRAVRDAMGDGPGTLAELATCDPEEHVRGRRTRFPGLGPDRLRLFHRRARLLTGAIPDAHVREPVDIPATRREVFFDIEADPMRGVVYLHGFVERTDGDPATERFTAFFAETADDSGERDAFARAISHLRERADATVFYYSKYERTAYRALCLKHPGVCPAEEIEEIFTPPRSIDLYFDVVFRAVEFPTHSQSIKALAKHLGFAWRDVDPSGAASIEWYHRWCETGDEAVRRRILDYNEDDCRATIVLLDAIRNLPLVP